MKITQMLDQKKLMLSFEVFPPKNNMTFEKIHEAALEVAKLKPDFISVTYGAGGGTSQYTVKLAEEIRERTGVEPLAHLSCVSSTREAVRAQISAIQEAGIENIMALRGDVPEGGIPSPVYHYAVDLIAELREAGRFCIGGACYPEVHPDSPDQKTDIRYLKEKVEAGVDFLTTQMFFDNNLFYNFLYKIREAGITVPVFPGIMPITTPKQVERAISMSNAAVPQRFRALVDRFGSEPEAMKQAGIAYATDQVIDLYANGIQNVHIYSMNKPDVARAIQENVSRIVGLPL